MEAMEDKKMIHVHWPLTLAGIMIAGTIWGPDWLLGLFAVILIMILVAWGILALIDFIRSADNRSNAVKQVIAMAFFYGVAGGLLWVVHLYI